MLQVEFEVFFGSFFVLQSRPPFISLSISD
jgi:hypothetical protein